MPNLLGIDLGTSSLKAMLIEPNGKVIAFCTRLYKFDVPLNGYAEQDPQVWWNACCEAVREILATPGISSDGIAAVGLSGQMHGTVLLDCDYNIIRPVILHCDSRSTMQCKRISDTLGEERLRDWVLNPIYSGFMLPSLLWVRDNEPNLYAKIKYSILPKDYIRYLLTDNLASDYSDASATLLFDIQSGKWSHSILETFEINPNILPPVYNTVEIAGTITARAASATGLAPSTPVVYGGGDQIMQAIGNGVISDSKATVNIGSSAQVCFPSDHIKINPKVTTNLFCGYKKNHWISMAATMSAGLSLSWWNNLVSPLKWAELDRQVEQIPPGSDGLLFFPYLGGERSPHLNPDLSASFLGITHGTTFAKMARAVMEGVTFALYDCINACADIGLDADIMIASGGGANSAPWLQMQADVFNRPLKLAENPEQAALGAAICAGVGAGLFRSVAQGVNTVVRYQDRIVEPNQTRHSIYLQYYELFQSAFTAHKDTIEILTRLGRISGN